ncbi:MAG: GNAT family N-acetyltransferase [Peptococcaceae bacterium]|jgi:predicted acetyltransferase|nr:GNAT family N-acetyltransferase [Peptococcaceae bacterium]
MDIRVLNEKERSMAVDLWQYCFADAGVFAEWYFRRRAEDVLAMMDGGSLVAQLVCVPMAVDMRGAARDAMMLSGVATAPAHRGRGHMTTIMRQGLAFLRDKGFAAAVLYPYDYGFYNQYGFASCGEVARVNVPISRLLSVKLRGEILPVRSGATASAMLARAYEASFARYSGRVLRGPEIFDQRLEEYEPEGGYAAVYCREGREEGYLLYQMNDKTLFVNEIGGATHIARQDLTSFLASHSSTMEAVEFVCALEDPLWRLLPDPRGAVSAQPYDMMRIIDVGKAMGGLPAGEGSVTLQIRDPFAPWNEGVWRFSSCGGVLAAECVSEGEAPVLSINDLTRWAFGCADGSTLAGGGAELPEAMALAMDALLPGQPFFLYETY